MSTVSDFDRLLVSTLDATGPTGAPPSVVDAAVAQARLAKQERPLLPAVDRRAWPARRTFRGGDRRTVPTARRTMIVALGALLILALLGVAAAGGMLQRPALVHVRPSTLVIQEWNGLRDPDSVVRETAYEPGSGTGVAALQALPDDAVGLRWSPDGSRLAYWERDAPVDQHGLPLRGLFLAHADGTGAIPVTLPRPRDVYASNGWWAGVQWAPTGDLFALSWNTYQCSDGPDCIPPGGIDVFDVNGQSIAAIKVVNSVDGRVLWSPDGRTVGWTTGSCSDGYCINDALHTRLVQDAATLTTLPLRPETDVTWSLDNRLSAVVLHSERHATTDATTYSTTVERVYSMAPDGNDVRDVAWDHASALRPSWSPDGHLIAAVDSATGQLTVRDAATGSDVSAKVPTGLDIAGWSPESDRLLLDGASETNPQAYALYVVAADGTGFASLGDGDDFAWRPHVAGPTG